MTLARAHNRDTVPLNDTKNLPNKGDVIKNITSCEIEKVAWEQG